MSKCSRQVKRSVALARQFQMLWNCFEAARGFAVPFIRERPSLVKIVPEIYIECFAV